MNEWKTIDTAPKDGTICIVAGPIKNDPEIGYFVTAAKFVASSFCNTDTSGWIQMQDDEGVTAIWEPEFWMPLPAPPKHNPINTEKAFAAKEVEV